MKEKQICDECYECSNYIDNNDFYTCQGSDEICDEYIDVNKWYGGGIMNKYEEALDMICKLNCHEASIGGCDGHNMSCYIYGPLKELVEKVTPIKPCIYDDTRNNIDINGTSKGSKTVNVFECCRCGSYIDDIDGDFRPNYCPNCGQELC